VGRRAEADGLHVRRALAEVLVANLGEARDVLVHYALEGSLGNQPALDVRLDLLGEAPILEHHAVGVDDRAVELREPARQPNLQRLQLADRFRQRALEAHALGGNVVRAAFLDRREADRRLQDVRAPAPESGRRRQTVQPALAGAPADRRLGLDPVLVGVQALHGADHAALVLAPLLLLAAQVLHQA